MVGELVNDGETRLLRWGPLNPDFGVVSGGSGAVLKVGWEGFDGGFCVRIPIRRFVGKFYDGLGFLELQRLFSSL